MNRSTWVLRITGFVVAVIAIATPARASSLVPMNLPEMVGKADRIVVARAVDEWTGRDERGIPATITTFEISRALRGGPLRSLRVKQFGVTRVQPDGLAAWIDGMPRYERGRGYLSFVPPERRLGFAVPVG